MRICFSVIVPLYNKQKQIRRTIDSVLSQSYKDFEIMVVDDGSTDSSVAIVKSYEDSRIKLYHKENGGVSSARNYGIKYAANQWIVPLDADDVLLPNALYHLSLMIEKYPTKRYFSGRTRWKNLRKGSECFVNPKLSRFPHFMIWLRRIDPAPRNIAIHKSLIENFGYYDQRQSFYEDWDFSIRMAQCGEIVYSDIYLAEYEQDGQGLSASRHPVEKEMAYYIPEIIEKQKPGLWYKALLYETIELTKLCWQDNPDITAFYNNMQREYFSWIFPKLHWLRQKLLRHGWL